MKYLHTLVITGFLIPFLPLCAENEEASHAISATSAIHAEQEEASLSSLEEELSLLDEEFEEFKEELFSLENDLLLKKETPPTLENVQASLKTPESPAALEMSQPEAPLTVSSPVFPIDEQVQESPTLEFTPAAAVEAKTQPLEETSLIDEKIAQDSPATLDIQGTSLIGEFAPKKSEISVDLNQAFAGSPIIYSILFAMSVIALSIWLYAILSLKSSVRLSGTLLKSVRNKLSSNNFDEALSLCTEQNNLFCKMVASGIQTRRHGLPVMIEAMKAEGKRTSIAFWQKLGLLNDITIIAPMIGLLGTVLGMFYAFYDINRSIESISTLFDGLGVSVGTTVAGLIVAILALILHSTAKYRLVRTLAQVENEAQSVATLIDDRTSIYKG